MADLRATILYSGYRNNNIHLRQWMEIQQMKCVVEKILVCGKNSRSFEMLSDKVCG